jgi:uncharacterized protein
MSGVALITGASAGLGLELAKLFAKDKVDLVLVARRRDKLDALASELSKEHGVKVHVVAADLTDHAAPKAIFDQVTALGVPVDYVVNNAGFGSNGAFVELDAKREVEMVEVNVTALLHLTRLFLPGMVQRKRGRVLNVGSTAGFFPGPFMATYFATKAFVLSFTEALAFELEGTGVTATVLCPGATATEFAQVAGNDKSKLFQSGVADAASVARAGYLGMKAGKVIAVPGAMNRLNVFLGPRLAPRGLIRKIAARLNRA